MQPYDFSFLFTELPYLIKGIYTKSFGYLIIYDLRLNYLKIDIY